MIRAARVLLALCIFLPLAARAQVGSSTDILTGVVRGPDGQPLEGATVEAMSLETQITRRAQTGASGRYTIVFPDGGGQYRLTVRIVGMAPQQLLVARQADEDRLVRDVSMSPTVQRLQTVTVRGRAPRAGFERPTPGESGRNITGDQAARLPVDAGDLNALATLAPGVVPIAGTDTTAEGFSIAGLAPTLNDITVDGLTFGASSLPQDAIRSTRVITNTYDVARGQFIGGVVATTTRGGTNAPSGSFTYALRTRDLAFGVDSASPFAQGYTQNQLGGGFGGPIVHDRLFIFGALQGRRRTDVAPTLLGANPAALARLGVSGDSVARFLGDVGALGLPMAPVGFAADRRNDNVVGLVRLDWLVADNHTLTLRGDWRWSDQDPTRAASLALPVASGTQGETGGGLMATLTSRFGTLINELRAYASTDRRAGDAFLALPAGRVQVASSLGDTARAVSTLIFGGAAGLPLRSDTRLLEASDELSWLPGDASHRLKLGGLLDVQRFRQDVTTNRLGTFTYNSLADLEADRPATFTRTLAPQVRSGTQINPSLYLGDAWRRGRALQLTYGVRLEGSTFAGAPAFNPAVDSLFGLRTDRLPSELHLSPRAGFTWIAGGGGFGPPPLTVRGGIGEFRTPAPTGLFAGAQGATGLAGAEEQLVCVGPAVPAPDWSGWLADPSSIPTTCAAGASPTTIAARPSVTVFDPSFAAPRAWRGSLGVQRRFLERFGVSVDASWSRGTSMVGVRDLNLDATPRFTLPDEGNRPVFVPAAAIVPATGAADFFASRLHPGLGHVLQLGSTLGSRSEQVTVGLNGFTLRGLVLQTSYTWLRARDQSSFTCCAAAQGLQAATTAGNPNVPAWSTSDYERRHSFLLTATYPITETFELTAVGRLLSGTPFTPMVNADINGDGLRNDRAFIFDPRTAADTAVANAMQRVIAGASGAVRDCLTSQLGAVAARNSCRGPWQPALDFQLNVRPSALGLDRRLTISLLTTNFLGGLDHLLHGADHLHGWGAFAQPDPTLLYLRGFDPATPAYRYQVNEHFGSTSGSALVFRAPFQIGLQLRYALGPDQARDRLRGIFGGGRGGPRGGMAGAGQGAGEAAADFLARFERLVPNPLTAILARRDTLRLTPEQAARLTTLRDSLDRDNGALADSVRAAIDRAGDRPDAARLFSDIRPRLQAGRANAQRALEAARRILTPEQWRALPADVRSGRGPGMRGGPGRGGAGP